MRRIVALTAVMAALLPAVAGAEGSWWHPPKQLTWYWQLTGRINNTRQVAAYDIDGFETEAVEVAKLHSLGRHVICYLSVGTAENWRPDYKRFPPSVLGGADEGWPGERWLDIRQIGVIGPIMEARFQMCRQKGFDAVEPDNIEAYSNNSGFQITGAEQLAYNEWVAVHVHALGMAVFQKNDAEQTAQLHTFFDGALSEECNRYAECAEFAPYLAAGEPVLDAEYGLVRSRFCPADKKAGIMGARYDLALDGKRFEPCW